MQVLANKDSVRFALLGISLMLVGLVLLSKHVLHPRIDDDLDSAGATCLIFGLVMFLLAGMSYILEAFH